MPSPLRSPKETLRSLTFRSDPENRFLADAERRICLAERVGRSGFAPNDQAVLRDKVVLVLLQCQLDTALAALALDGYAKRILLCTPSVVEWLPDVAREAEADWVVCDTRTAASVAAAGLPPILYHADAGPDAGGAGHDPIDTEWVLFTSGTTGRPKMAVHSLASLAGPLNDNLAVGTGTVWSTFYDIRRYGGLTILFRALLGGGSMVFSLPPCKPIGEFLTRAGQLGVTHISGTPSHWRKVLMTQDAGRIAPDYVRMSGEIADQAIIRQLQIAYPSARVAHAFATTEVGFAFDVNDGLAGFPATYIESPSLKADLRIINGTLWVRSNRAASTYIGRPLMSRDGFIDTGDLVERQGDRYYFVGRAEGVINVGGQKVFPEEVEAVLMRHPAVQACRVYGRKNPITGALVRADLVLKPEAQPLECLRSELVGLCQEYLAAWKTPVSFQSVATVALTTSGKIARHG